MKRTIRTLLTAVLTYVQRIVKNYTDRVAAAGGVVGATSCVSSALTVLDRQTLLTSATFVLIPSGYKSGTVYAQIPNNGNGDLTFTRGSAATRTNESGVIESVASGVQRLDYSLDGCPVALYEPQRRNNFLQSGWANGSLNTAPTLWTRNQSGGTIQPVSSIYGSLDGANAYSFSVTNNRDFLSQSVTTVANRIYAISVYVESVTGNVAIQDVIRRTTILTGEVLSYLVNNVSAAGSTNAVAGTRITLLYYNTVGGSVTIGIGLGISGSVTAAITLSRPQHEDNGASGSANYSTSYIPTSGATVTRLADAFTRSNIYTNGLISASGGTWFVELKNNVVYTRGGNAGLGINLDVPAGFTNGISIRNSLGTGRLTVQKIILGTAISLFNTDSPNIKLAIKWDGAYISIFQNGLVCNLLNNIGTDLTKSTFSIVDMGSLLTGFGVPYNIQQMALWNLPLSDAQCISLTS